MELEIRLCESYINLKLKSIEKRLLFIGLYDVDGHRIEQQLKTIKLGKNIC